MESSLQSLDKVEEASRYGNLPRAFKLLFILLTVCGAGLAVFTMFGFSVGGVALFDVQYYYLLIACFLPSAFLLMPMRKKDKGILRWYDIMFAALALGGSLYLFTEAYSIVMTGWFPVSPNNFAVATILLALILEAARRGGSTVFLIVCLFMGLYPIFAGHMPGIFFGISSSWDTTIGYMVLSSDGLLGIPLRVLGDLLLGFLVFAAVLVASGAGKFFLNLALALLGRFRGGPAKVAVLSSGFFGSLSGSIFANIVATGSVTIPTMKRTGYPSHYAAAIEACASTGGVLMPPVMGALIFIMCAVLNMEYAVVMVAAFIPAILYYFGLLMQVDAYAGKVGLKGLPRVEIPSIVKTLKEGWPFIAVLVFLVWGLLYMRWERLAPWYASGLMLLLSFARRETRPTLGRIIRMLKQTGELMTRTFSLILPLGLIIGGFTMSGTAPAFTAAIINLGGESIFLVLLLGVATCYVLGMVGVGVGAYVFLAVTLAPALVEALGVNVLAVHLFIVYYAMLGAITPPVALGSFVAASVAGSSPMKTAVQSMRLGIVIYLVPFFFLFNPSLILQGSILEVLYLFPLCLLGIVFIAGGMEGYLVKVGKVPLWVRPLLVVAGFLIALPGWMTSIIGAVLALLIIPIILKTREKVPAITEIR